MNKSNKRLLIPEVVELIEMKINIQQIENNNRMNFYRLNKQSREEILNEVGIKYKEKWLNRKTEKIVSNEPDRLTLEYFKVLK